jgi:Protein of unknown function (DUF3306)
MVNRHIPATTHSADDDTRSNGFLSRWSRRKQDVRAGKPLAEPVQPVLHNAAQSDDAKKADEAPISEEKQRLPQQNRAQEAIKNIAHDNPQADPNALPPAPTLDDAQALTPQSDFKPYMARNVSPEVKNAAMKKLFADPHYNVMDMMDVYVDDYSKPDPIPAEMLKQMVAVKFLKLFERDEEQSSQAAPADASSTPDAAPVIAENTEATPLVPSADGEVANIASIQNVAQSPLALDPAPAHFTPRPLSPHS